MKLHWERCNSERKNGIRKRDKLQLRKKYRREE
jgi:hypothetical protein